MAAREVQAFPSWDQNGGLSKMSTVKKMTSLYDTVRFKRFIRKSDHPSYFISRDTWDILLNGLKVSNGVAGESWVKEGMEVSGFVFCMAIRKRSKKESTARTMDDGYAYFRIRTLLRKSGSVPETIGGAEIPAWVERDFIAYTNIERALIGGPEDDCVVFIHGDDAQSNAERDLVNSEVYSKGDKVKELDIATRYFGSLEDVFGGKGRKKSYNSLFANEGSIFSKERIIEILNNHPESKGITVSLGMRENKQCLDPEHKGGADCRYRHVYLRLEINPVYEAVRPCPQPPTCQ